MRRTFFAALLVIAASLSVFMGMGGVMAQENQTNATNETNAGAEAIAEETAEELVESETNETNETAESPDVEAPEDYEQPVDSRTRITDWEYSDGVFQIDVEAEMPTRITVVEWIDFEEGSGAPAVKREAVPSGSSTITMRVPPKNGEAKVLVQTKRGIEQDEMMAYLSTGQVAQPSPWERTSSIAGWFGGVSVMAICLVGAAWKEIRRTYDAPEDAL